MSQQQVNAETCAYAFLDFDINCHRRKLATAAAFVDATDTRYGHSSKDLLSLGGSELSRLDELIENDHEWSAKAKDGIETRPPACGNRIVVKLYWDVAPLACENFATLCLNGGLNGGLLPSQQMEGKAKIKPAPVGESGKQMTYRNCTVHRIVPQFIIQAGDFVFGNGSGGESVYGKKFKDERAGLVLHHRRGILSMGNSGKNSNTSQFFFTFDKAPQCDGKHVVFGEIVSGFEVLDALEAVGSKDGTPSVPVTITECGIFAPLLTPAAGYWFDVPDDSFEGSTPVFVVRPRVVIVAPSEGVASKFSSALSGQCAICSTLIHADGNDKSVVSRLMDLLETFQCDVVVVAPSVADEIVTEITDIPTAWRETTTGVDITVGEIILKVKPVEAMAKIHSGSWLATKRTEWKLDGVS